MAARMYKRLALRADCSCYPRSSRQRTDPFAQRTRSYHLVLIHNVSIDCFTRFQDGVRRTRWVDIAV